MHFLVDWGENEEKQSSWSHERDEPAYSQNYQYKKCMIFGKESSSSELDAENSSPGTLGLIMRRPVSYLSACVLIIFHVRFYQNANTTHKINIMRFFAFVFFSLVITGRKGGREG